MVDLVLYCAGIVEQGHEMGIGERDCEYTFEAGATNWMRHPNGDN